MYAAPGIHLWRDWVIHALNKDLPYDEFVRTHPDTREAREIAFWKAAYMVDPANHALIRKSAMEPPAR